MSPVELSPRRQGRPKNGSFPEPLRTLLIAETIRRVGCDGTTDVTARQVAEAVGVQPATINYNFQSWNGLIADAGLTCYIDYVEGVWAEVNRAPKNPEARMRAYFVAQREWGRTMPGWSAFFDYPFSAKSAAEILQKRHGDTMNAYFELNYARLYALVRDLQQGVVTDITWDADTYPRGDIIMDQRTFNRAVMVGWTSLGVMVWSGRRDTMAKRMSDLNDFEQRALDYTFDELIRVIKDDSASSSLH